MISMALDQKKLTVHARKIPRCCVVAGWILTLFLPGFIANGQRSEKQINSFNSKLSSDWIFKTVQDQKGYLWIATDDGLNQYDGYTFTVYKNIPGDSTSIPDNDIRALTVDPSGNVWIGFSDGHLAYYLHSTRSFTTINAPKLGIISLIYFDKSGRLWVGVMKDGLYYFDAVSNYFVKAGDLPFIHKGYLSNPEVFENYNTIYEIHEDSEGNFWMATHDGLYTYNPKTKTFLAVREKKITPFEDRNDLFRSILPSEEGIWLSGWGGGLTFYNVNTHEWKNYKPGVGDVGTRNIIVDMEWKEKNQIWVASLDQGFGYFDIEKEKFTFSNVKRAATILKDNRATLWVSSEGNGLFQFDPDATPTFHPINISPTINNDYYFTHSFYHDLNNHLLYFGVSYGDGLHVYHEKTNREKIFSFEHFEPGLHISSIYNDKTDTLWVLTNDFIYTYNRQQEKLIKFSQPFDRDLESKKGFSINFTCITRTRNGDLWVGAYDGLYKYDFISKKFVTYSTANSSGLASNWSRRIMEDNFGRLWVMSKRSISILSSDRNHFEQYNDLAKTEKFASNIDLMDMTKSPNGDLWISSNNGIYQYDHRKNNVELIHWSVSSGVPSGKIISIESDQQGRIWFLMYSGVWCLEPESKKITQNTKPAEKSETSSMYIDNENTIYLGAYRGYSTFNPKTQLTKPIAPPLVITSFKINNKEILADSLPIKGLKLDYSENTITIEFAALDFRNASKNKYSFMMEGLAADWSPPDSEQRLANYQHLPAGDYTFKVKAAALDGVWTRPIEITIHISHPFWSTWYFRLVIGMVIVCILYLLQSWSIKVNRKKLELGERLLQTEMSSLRAQMNPHFIFNSLNSINKFILMADRETASFYLTKFSKLIRLILENSNKSKISLDQELTALKHYIDMELLRFDHNFSYSIDIDPQIDPLIISFPPLIIQPYVENSIWHGFTKRDVFGKLTIAIKKESSNLLLITVEDNGVGRGAKKGTLDGPDKKSHGLKITSDRLLALSKHGNPSSIEIIDLKNDRNEPSGTRVVIKLPIGEPMNAGL
jgi:ligand-binding sensor domain-containing protein